MKCLIFAWKGFHFHFYYFTVSLLRVTCCYYRPYAPYNFLFELSFFAVALYISMASL